MDICTNDGAAILELVQKENLLKKLNLIIGKEISVSHVAVFSLISLRSECHQTYF